MLEIEKLKKALSALPEKEVKSLLFHIFLKADLVKVTEYTEANFIQDVLEIKKKIVDRLERPEMDEKRNVQMVHIVFGPSAEGSLRISLKNLGLDEKERIISFWELFSVGPVFHLEEENGVKARFDWLKQNMNEEDDHLQYQQKFQQTIRQIASIPDGTPITIWTGENAHEQTGMRFVLYLLRDRPHQIMMINTTKAYHDHFHSPHIQFVPLHSGEIAPEKIQILCGQKKQPLSQLEREQLEQEWLELSNDRGKLRIWRSGKIHSVPEDYFDSFIIHKAEKLHGQQGKKDYMKAARLIGEVIGHLEQYVGDQFIEYRVRKLIEKGIFEMEGSLKAMRYYQVKIIH
ncbi:DUF1835 domain-containing protein [Aeribacillus sp. FSL M8-0254]|uniref:DUF1835 domain-containing protein n=1 Tax=Aeribacillus sp. FSL M8-0254 TaxID=2954577 RepID=UPI0030F78201